MPGRLRPGLQGLGHRVGGMRQGVDLEGAERWPGVPQGPALGGRRELSSSPEQRRAAPRTSLSSQRSEPSPRPRRPGSVRNGPASASLGERVLRESVRLRSRGPGVENFPLDALSNGLSASVCVRIFPGGRLQVILSPSKLFRPPPPQKSLTPAGKDINERICGKKRKVNESGGPPSANGPGKRKEAKGVRSWTWGEGWGGGRRGGFVQTLGIRARAPGVDPGIVPSSPLSPGNKYPVYAAHECIWASPRIFI